MIDWEEAIRQARLERKEWEERAEALLKGARQDICRAIFEELKKCDIPMLPSLLESMNSPLGDAQYVRQFIERLADDIIRLEKLRHRG